MRSFVSLVVLVLLISATFAEDYCQGCGCKGGPGYRAPNGQCVGWKQLDKVCGSPPTTRCTAEGPALLGTPALGLVSLGKSEAAPVTSNNVQALGDGVGCLTTTNLEAWQSCPTGNNRCETQRKDLLDSKACVAIPQGMAVTIEASSRSFDWLRVRVPGATAPVWTDRALLLGGR